MRIPVICTSIYSAVLTALAFPPPCYGAQLPDAVRATLARVEVTGETLAAMERRIAGFSPSFDAAVPLSQLRTYQGTLRTLASELREEAAISESSRRTIASLCQIGLPGLGAALLTTQLLLGLPPPPAPVAWHEAAKEMLADAQAQVKVVTEAMPCGS